MRRGSSAARLLAPPVVLAVAASFAVPALLSDYYLFLATSAVVAGVAFQSLGIVGGRAGMLSLCQMTFAGIGAWTVAWLNVEGAPGSLLLWIPLGGLAAVPFGVAVGLPALRLRGINLAVVTLGFAVSADVVLAATSFPGQSEFLAVPRPEAFVTDARYFALCVVVFALVAIGIAALSRTRLGASWISLANSERATAVHGVSVPLSKLSAFALSAFVAGLSGGLLAGQLGTLVAQNFATMQSLVLFALAVMAGAGYAEGALFAGVLLIFFPEVLRRLGWSQELGNVFFAVGATQALSSGAGQSELLRKLLRRRLSRRRAAPAAVEAPAPAPLTRPAAGAALAVRGLTVRFGSVEALRDVELQVPRAEVAALVGPNGAGKSTLIDAVTGFLPSYEGSVHLDGEPLDRLGAHRRARRGVRRTFQHTRIAPALTVGQYLRLAAGRGPGEGELNRLLAWFGCPPARTLVAEVDVGSRRALDVAGAVAARPRVVLLDEPAAGQAHDESLALAERIADLPRRFGGMSVLLVEHDIDLVRLCSSSVTVLDFGRVISSGTPQQALADPAVVAAYLGVAEPEEAGAPA